MCHLVSPFDCQEMHNTRFRNGSNAVCCCCCGSAAPSVSSFPSQDTGQGQSVFVHLTHVSLQRRKVFASSSSSVQQGHAQTLCRFPALQISHITSSLSSVPRGQMIWSGKLFSCNVDYNGNLENSPDSESPQLYPLKSTSQLTSACRERTPLLAAGSWKMRHRGFKITRLWNFSPNIQHCPCLRKPLQ